MRGPNGEEAWGQSVYIEIVPPERLVFGDAFADAEGAVNEALPRLHVTITLTEQDGITTLTDRTRCASTEDLERLVAMGMVEGFSMSLDQLAAELAV
jgi:uncharacterized protein YndB with AHSA1/START domain